MMRHFGRCVGPLLATLAASALASSVQALKPLRGYPAVPAEYGVIYQDVTLETPDSLRLRGWFFPAQDTTGIANDIIGRRIPVPPELKKSPRPYPADGRHPRPTIVISDGDAGNTADFILYAYQFFTRGFNVFTFDWRGFGESDEWPMDGCRLCYVEFLTDFNAAIDFVKTHPQIDPASIGVLGFSTGAYLSFAMAASRDDTRAMVGRARVSSFADLLPILRSLDPERNFQAPADYSEELWVVPGSGHGGHEAPEFVNYPEFFVRAAGFFARHLDGNAETERRPG